MNGSVERAALVAYVRASRTAQGFPPKIEDQTALRKAGRLLGLDAPTKFDPISNRLAASPADGVNDYRLEDRLEQGPLTA